MTNIYIKQLELGPMANFTYIVGDPTHKVCAVIDAGWEAEKVMKVAEKDGYKITHVLLTHSHFDHVRAANNIAKSTGAPIFVHKLDAPEVNADDLSTFLNDDIIKVGALNIKAIHTPGHSPGSSCFLVGNALFTGDTLFDGAIGRTDLPGSDPEEMFKSLIKLSKLPDGTIVYPGHDYGNSKTSTIGEQKKINPYMQRP